MKRIILMGIFSILFGKIYAQKTIVEPPVSFYNLSFTSITGERVDFKSFKGKKVLLVNTASKCGFTPQFADLEKLSREYKDQLILVGFPSNDFGSQDPGSNSEIQEFCQLNYGVTFLMMEKSDVKGNNKNPVFQWLTDKSANGWNTTEPSWNFCKYLIDEKGRLKAFFPSRVKPLSDDIVNLVKGNSDEVSLLIGTYTSDKSEGVYVYRFNTENADFEYVNQVKVSNPSYLQLSGDGTLVYSVSENPVPGATANAFSFSRGTGILTLLNSQEAKGSDPCYINISPKGNFVLTANYSGGSLSVFPVEKDGKLGPVSQVIGFDSVASENKASHIHTCIFSPDGEYLFVTDLGKDCIYRLKVFRDSGDHPLFLRESFVAATLEPGSGPRHLTFHPNGKFLYCINELSGKVTAFRYENSGLEAFQYIVLDKSGNNDKKGSADIHISPDGRFLYASNRLKNDGIAIFSIHPKTGSLKAIGYQPTGVHPRNFLITSNGKFLLVANRDSNTIQIFSIDRKTGLLKNTGKELIVDKPVCLQMM